MKKNRLAVIVLTLGFAIFSVGCSKRDNSSPKDDSWVQTSPVAPEAEPVRNWLQSIKAKDVELFKTVFSNRIKLIMEKQGWGRSLGVYTVLLTEQFGDFDVEELTYAFTKDSNLNSDSKSGTIEVTKDGQTFPPIAVIFEDGCWKVDER